MVDNVCLESEMAGMGAAKYILEEGRRIPTRFIRLIAGDNTRYIVPTGSQDKKRSLCI